MRDIQPESFRWRRGSRLVIFSDGLTDAQNAEEEEFGDERVIECCKSIPAEIDAKEWLST